MPARRRTSIVVNVNRVICRDIRAADREHASDRNRIIARIHTRDRESISSVERAWQALQIHASAGGCGPIELYDERMFVIHELDTENLGAICTDLCVVGNQRERALAGAGINRERSSSNRVA